MTRIQKIEALKSDNHHSIGSNAYDRAIDDVLEILRAETVIKCEWKIDELNEGFITSCKHELTIFNNSGDLIKDFADIGYIYCTYCGKLIKRIGG